MRSRACSRCRVTDVEREFYVNDAGSQVRKLGESIQAIARREPVPEDGYKGDYVVDLVSAEAHYARGRASRRARRSRGDSGIRASLEAFGVRIRRVVRRESAARGDERDRGNARARSSAHGDTYRRRARCGCARTAHGDDRDRVLMRTDGEPTYFGSDIAYHQDKRERGFDAASSTCGAQTTTATSRG